MPRHPQHHPNRAIPRRRPALTLLALLTAAVLTLTACAPANLPPESESPSPANPTATAAPIAAAANTPAPTPSATPPASAVTSDTPAPTNTAIPTPTADMPASDTAVMTLDAATADQTRQRFARLLRADWATDFTRATIDYADIMTGGPPKDGIPSIDDPQFESIAAADQWLADLEPVQVVNLNGDARAYPVQVMVWHELVNDTVGGVPVVITF